MNRKPIVTALLLCVILCIPLFSQSQDFQIEGTVLVQYRGNAENVTIPESVTAIGTLAFFLCVSLTNITIPTSVTYIGRVAFYGCSGLTTITIPSSVVTIKDNAFYNCNNLTSITIPASVTSIGDYAFSGCNNLKTVTVSRKTAIGNNAFPAQARITYSD